MNTKVIVMGRNYASLLGMIRAVGILGCDVSVIHTVRKYNWKATYPDRVSKYVKRWTYAIEPDRKDLMKKIQSFSVIGKKSILLPTDDFTAAVIDSCRSELEENFLFPYFKNDLSMLDWMDKTNQKKLAAECGLPVADSWLIKAEDGKYQIPEDLFYPCFPKPQISYTGDKTCMRKCETRHELKEALDPMALKFNDPPILVEQYHPIDQEYGVLGVSDGRGVVIPALIQKQKIGHGSHEGVTLLGRVMTFEGQEPFRKKLQDFVEKTGFVGLFDIDLYESGGTLYFNEINLRLGAFGYAIVQAGVNLPEILVNGLMGHEQKNYDIQIKKEMTCLSEKVNFEDFAAGYIDRDEYQDNIERAEDYFMNVPDDQKPYRAFQKMLFRRQVKQGIRKVLKKG